MIASLQESLEAANQLAAQRLETIEYLKKQLYGASSKKRKKSEEPQADGQLTLFDMYAQIFDEAEYHHDPKATEPEQAVVVKEHVRKGRKTMQKNIRIFQRRWSKSLFRDRNSPVRTAAPRWSVLGRSMSGKNWCTSRQHSNW